MSSSERFGENLRRLRIGRGFRTQDEFARALGVTVFTVNRYERGRYVPGFDRLTELAMLLDCSVTDLLPNGEEAA